MSLLTFEILDLALEGEQGYRLYCKLLSVRSQVNAFLSGVT